MKHLLKTGLLIFILVFTAACSSNEAGSTTKSENEITFWAPFSGPDGPNMKKIVDQFNKSQEDYTIQFEIKPSDGYYKALDLVLNDQKNVPDLFILHGNHIPTYAEKGILKKLDDVTGELIKEENYNQTAWKGAEYKGELYGIPLDVHPLILYWNKKMFKEAGLDPNDPPVNREEFINYAKKLTNKEEGQYGFVVPTGSLQEFIFPTIVYQNGGKLLTDSKEINYHSEPVIEALQFQRDLIAKYEVAPSDVQDSPTPLFLQGKAAMILNGPWMINQFKESPIEFGSAPIPQLGTEKQAVYGNSHNFVLPATLENDEKIKGIQEFLKYVSEHGMAWAEAGQAPASKAVYESEEFQELKHQPNVAKQFDYVKFSPEIPKWGQIAKPLYEQVNLVLIGEKKAEKAMEDAAKESKVRMKE